jgi:hypothetical protein
MQIKCARMRAGIFNDWICLKFAALIAEMLLYQQPQPRLVVQINCCDRDGRGAKRRGGCVLGW